MKKQYKAPSVEIELEGVGTFCAGCADQILNLTGLESDTSCIDVYNDFRNPAFQQAICYNAPNDTFVITTS